MSLFHLGAEAPLTTEETSEFDMLAFRRVADLPYGEVEDIRFHELQERYLANRRAVDVGPPSNEDFLTQLRRVNGDRWNAWAGGTGEDPLYQSNEFAGEAGEVCNEVKKLVREQRGWRGSRTTTEKLGDEIADAIICLDSIARGYGLDLAEVVAAKFNKTSEANDFPHRLSTLPA